MKPVLASLEAEGVAVQQIDYDAERPLADHHGVTVLPTTIVVESDVEVARREGGLSLEELRALVRRQNATATKAEREAKRTELRPSVTRRRVWRYRRGRMGTADRRSP
jgi:peptide deformylase